jgi:CRP-like cAMP-binding protein
MSQVIDPSYFKDNREIIDKLREVPTLRYFDDEDIERLLALSSMIEYQAGELIIEEGQYDNWIYFIISGSVEIQKDNETIGVLDQVGDIFGEMGIVEGLPRSASIVATVETECLSIDVSDADDLQADDRVAFTSILYQVFAQILASRLRVVDGELVKALEENAKLKAEISELRAG